MIHGLTGLTCLPHARLIKRSWCDGRNPQNKSSGVITSQETQEHIHISTWGMSPKLRTQKKIAEMIALLFTLIIFNMYHSGLLVSSFSVGDLTSNLHLHHLGHPTPLIFSSPAARFALGAAQDFVVRASASTSHQPSAISHQPGSVPCSVHRVLGGHTMRNRCFASTRPGELTMERSTMLLMGKSTTFLWPFSIAMLVHQRVHFEPNTQPDQSTACIGLLHQFWLTIFQSQRLRKSV